MAVIFTPQITGSPIVLGGQGTNPFPKYSISKENTILSREGTLLCSKYNITISGKFIVDSSIDITDSGARQSDYNSQMAYKLDLLKQYKNISGKLEIDSYGGKPGKLIYNDAKLLTVSLPESPEESSAVLYSDYNLTFEASVDVSGTDASYTLNQFNYNMYFIDSIEESWNIEIEDDIHYPNNDITQTPERNYVITHNISAGGLRKPLSGGGLDKSAWYEAQKWVNSRVVDSPLTDILNDFMGGTDITSFNSKFFGNVSNVSSTDLTAYGAYNHIRKPDVNLTDGTYSIVETWKISKSKAAIDLEISEDIGDDQIVNVTLNGTITGFDEQSLNSTLVKKIQNAETALITVESKAYNLCKTHYDKLGTGFTLNNVIRSKSIGRNPNNGTISFSYTFSDKTLLISNAIATDLNISDDNINQNVQIAAILMVIAKDDGPIIQDMKTTKERKRSLQMDVTMDRSHRTIKPTEPYTVALTYKPDGSAKVQNFVENWSPITGAYSLSMDWVF